MKSAGRLRNRRFLKKILLIVTLGLAVMITLFSAILYFFIESLVIRIESESNRNLMAQVQYNVRFIGQTIKNTCEHLYLNSDVAHIMNFGDSDRDFEEGMIRMNLVWNSVKDSNPFIHSIFIYNNNTKRFYSTYGGMLFEDKGLLEYLENREDVPRMIPVFRKIQGSSDTVEATESVMSYFIYDTYDTVSGMKNGMVVNVRQQWLLDNLNEVNMARTDKYTQLFLMDSLGEFVEQEGDKAFMESLKEGHRAYLGANPGQRGEGSFTSGYKGDKYLVSYYQLDNAAVTVFKTITYKKIQAYVFQLQKVMIGVFSIFLLLTLLEAFFISKRIYNPFGSMVARIRSQSGKITGELDDRDELSFLSNVYDKNAELLEAYRRENHSNSSIVKNYLLRNLLSDGYTPGSEEPVKVLKANGIAIEEDTCYRVCLIKIDRYEALMKEWQGKDRDLIKFAILNIGCEIIGSRFVNDGLDMGEDYICLILCDKKDEGFEEIFGGLARELQTALAKYYGISVTVASSSPVNSPGSLSQAFGEASNLSYYRYVFGRGAVIFPAQMTGRSDEEGFLYSDKLEKKLLDTLMTGEAQKVEQVLKALMDGLSRLSYEAIVVAQVQLLRTLNQAVNELNRNRLESIRINFHELYRLPFHSETLEDFFFGLNELIHSILNKDRSKTVEARHTMLIEAVTAIIGEKYENSSLCLDEIAANLTLSSRQLSRVFKTGTGKTIPEYINEVRLSKAAELLTHTGLSVGEVASRVGIESETYFYSMFKRKYGTTPKEYAASKPFRSD